MISDFRNIVKNTQLLSELLLLFINKFSGKSENEYDENTLNMFNGESCDRDFVLRQIKQEIEEKKLRVFYGKHYDVVFYPLKDGTYTHLFIRRLWIPKGIPILSFECGEAYVDKTCNDYDTFIKLQPEYKINWSNTTYYKCKRLNGFRYFDDINKLSIASNIELEIMLYAHSREELLYEFKKFNMYNSLYLFSNNYSNIIDNEIEKGKTIFPQEIFSKFDDFAKKLGIRTIYEISGKDCFDLTSVELSFINCVRVNLRHCFISRVKDYEQINEVKVRTITTEKYIAYYIIFGQFDAVIFRNADVEPGVPFKEWYDKYYCRAGIL